MGLDSREVSQDKGGWGDTKRHTHTDTHIPASASAKCGKPDSRVAALRMPEKLGEMALPEVTLVDCDAQPCNNSMIELE